MQIRLLTTQRNMLLAPAVALAVAALAFADHRFQNLGWLLFAALALSVGMLHGALDALLLLREFNAQQKSRPLLFKMVLLYLLSAVAIGAVLALSVPLALMALLAMSIWHFGEPYGRWPSSQWTVRLVVGGASVMLPVLLSPVAMQVLMKQLFVEQASLIWLLWQSLAWVWLTFSVLQLLLLWRGKVQGVGSALMEVAVLVALNALLSPLTAFALYFGVYHSGSHIVRVLGAPGAAGQAATSRSALAQPLLWLTVLASAVLMLLLWRYALPAVQAQDMPQTKVLHWLIVTLAAVTLPHLLLVSRCAHWLQTPR